VACGGDRFTVELAEVTDRVWKRPGAFTIARCAACGLRQTRPIPGDLSVYYADTYDNRHMRAYDTGAGLGRWLHTYRLNLIRKVYHPGPADRFLDVGCSYGGFLAHVRQSAGASGVGVDVDAGVLGAPAVDGVELRRGTVDDIDGTFTVVTFYECLEHLPDPAGALRVARERLAGGGLLVVEVPHWDSLWRRVFGRAWLPLLVPQHLVHFDMPGLRAMVEGAGFVVLYHKTMFVPTELLMSLWVATGANAVPEHPTPLERVKAAAWLVAGVLVWTLAEFPTQLLLRIVDRSGTQVIIARKP
jgi:SAM-dependent methyltransferase